MESILKTINLTKSFNAKEKIIQGIDLEILPHSFVVMLGPSGCGKSTLLNILSGLLKPTSGQVFFASQEITRLSTNQLADWKRQSVGNIFQNYLLLNHLTVRENIEIGITPKQPSIPLDELVHLLQLDPLLDQFPAQLSGGQQQRVAIARAVIKKPRLLFCDEATGALDEANSKQVITLLHNLKKAFGITILFVTHNKQIAKTADRVITLKDGLIYQDYLNQNPISAHDMIWE